MARIFRNFSLEVTPDLNPNTLVQFVLGTNQRAVITGINLKPLGATGATAPLKFDLVTQDDAGTMVTAAANLFLVSPNAAETPVMTANKQQAAQTEPTTSTDKGYDLEIHQQQNLEWVPTNPFREIWMLGAERWGLRYKSAVFVPVVINISIEE